MMDWDKLRVFHAVAEAGSFTRAGDALGMSQSAVSRQIGALEDSAAAPLFHRHARGLILTEQGELLYRTVREVFAKLAMVEGQLAENKDHPKGQLKVTATVGLGSFWLAPRIGEFINIYPDVSVDLVLDDKELDLSMREADVAIRLVPPRQSELVQRHLMTIRNCIYAAPAYIQRYGVPETIDDLDRHKLVVYGDETAAAGAGTELAADDRRPRGSAAQAGPDGQQRLCHPAGGPERPGHRHFRQIHGRGAAWAGPGPAGG